MASWKGTCDPDYEARYSRDDANWVATCTRYPGVIWLAQSEGEALDGLRALVTACILDGDDCQN